MNIALGGLVIFLMFLPGLAFRTSLIKSESLENPLDSSRLAELLLVSVPSIIIHVFGFLIVECCTKYEVRIDQFYYLIAGKSINENGLDLKIIKDSIFPFFGYLLITIGIASVLGVRLKKLILHCFWDMKYSFIPITNEWDNLLSGRNNDFKIKNQINTIRNSQKSKSEKDIEISKVTKDGKIDFIELNVLVKSANNNILYTGILGDYFLSKNNKLDKLYLINASKKVMDLDDSGTSNTEKYQFPESTLVIKNSEIVNVNVIYKFIVD